MSSKFITDIKTSCILYTKVSKLHYTLLLWL